MDVSCPLRVRVADDPRIVVAAWHTRVSLAIAAVVDINGAVSLAGAHSPEIESRVGGGVCNSASHKPVPSKYAERPTDFGDRLKQHEVSEQEVRAGDALHQGSVARPAEANIPRIVQRGKRTEVEGDLCPRVLKDSGVLCFTREAR